MSLQLHISRANHVRIILSFSIAFSNLFWWCIWFWQSINFYL